MSALPTNGDATMKEYIPASWFHPRGIFKVLSAFKADCQMCQADCFSP